MSLLTARNRLIYFRVTEEELGRFRALAERKGSRSLSDLAREALERLNRPEPDVNAERMVPELLEKIHRLQDQVSEMKGWLREMSDRLPEREMDAQRRNAR